MIRLRFAPSPTGYLHAGGVRTALFNYLYTRQQGGVFVLRIDDTDSERSTEEYEKNILSELRWLGLNWDEGPGEGGDFGPYYQSQKLSRYQEIGEKLLSSGAVYRDTDKTLRLTYLQDEVVVHDVVSGDCHFTRQSLGPEPVLLRADGTPTYHLASVVDDIDMEITHVVRGQDHLTNTAKHQMICEALGAPLPVFVHLPLLLGEDGSKLSKRNSGGLSAVKDFREAGFLPEAIVNFLMLLGWSHPEQREYLTLEDGIKSFGFERVKSTAAVFDVKKLSWLNAHWIRTLPPEQIAALSLDFVGDYRNVIEERGLDFWTEAILEMRSSFETLLDAKTLAEELFSLELSFSNEAREHFAKEPQKTELREVLLACRELFQSLELDPSSDLLGKEGFKQFMSLLKKRVSVKGKSLFQPLRVLVTGSLSGPELKVLLPLLPRETLLSRLESIENQIDEL